MRRWYELTDPLVQDGAPDGQERYFIFQTLVGVWPIAPERLEGYVEKDGDLYRLTAKGEKHLLDRGVGLNA